MTSPYQTRVWLAVILGVQACALAYSASRHAPTWDEVGALGAGLSHWKFGTFGLYSVNPPLVRTLAAATVYWSCTPNYDWRAYNSKPRSRSEVQVGRDFVRANQSRFLFYFTIARWSCIPFVTLGTIICFLWARDLFGLESGLAAAAIWAFSPLVLGHGALLTPDVAASSFGVAGFYAFRCWLSNAKVGPLALCTVGFALALLCKSTWLLNLVIVPAVWVLWRRLSGRPHRQSFSFELAQLASCAIAVLLIFNAFYGFRGSFQQLKEFEFASTALSGIVQSHGAVVNGNRFEDTWLSNLPVPFPSSFVIGCDIQKQDFEVAGRAGGHRSYLLGQWKNGGWWYYYIVGLAVKSPLPWILALLLSVPLVCYGMLPGCAPKDAVALLLPSVVLFFFVSSQSSISSHVRYILPALPFLIIWTSQFAALLRGTSVLLKRLAQVAFAWFLIGSAAHSPHWLSYFNEITRVLGGGHLVLDNSNIDWGQDLTYLKQWQEKHPDVAELKIAYFGCIAPEWMGFSYEVPAPYFKPPEGRKLPNRLGPQVGWHAVSVNYVIGSTMPLPNGHNEFIYFDEPVFQYFSRFTPVARAGESIWIYHLDVSDVEHARSEMHIHQRRD